MFRSLFKLFLVLNLGVFAGFAAIDHVLIPAYHQQLSESERKEVGSYAFLLTGYLERHPGPAREAALQTLRRNAREGFAVVSMHAVAHLGERRLRDLRDGKIVFGDDGDDAYLPLRDGQVLHISQRNASQTKIELIAYTLIASATLLAVVGWLFYHWRELNALREAARQFGRGNLAARARLSRHANLYPLTRQFNDMASRIEASVMQQRDMIHGISHELKTPITRLEFGIALLQSADARPDPLQRAQRLEALRLDVRELDELVTELLTLGQLEQGATPVSPALVTAGELIDVVLAVIAGDAAHRGVVLDVRNSRPFARHLCDPRLVARALLKLCRNALRNARRKVIIVAQTDATGTLTLAVEDDGPAVSAPERARIFEPPPRAMAGRESPFSRAGLDLVIVRRIALAHGGRVSLDSGVAGCTRFTITLPARYLAPVPVPPCPARRD
ncbi:ATP-binding protein [Cupriavidus basilensis]|uniref:ATP-binding protein n=1 Tax=Cupriavidus basilensis TaxID=68895 RepID=UPI0039F6A8B4